MLSDGPSKKSHDCKPRGGERWISGLQSGRLVTLGPHNVFKGFGNWFGIIIEWQTGWEQKPCICEWGGNGGRCFIWAAVDKWSGDGKQCCVFSGGFRHSIGRDTESERRLLYHRTLYQVLLNKSVTKFMIQTQAVQRIVLVCFHVVARWIFLTRASIFDVGRPSWGCCYRFGNDNILHPPSITELYLQLQYQASKSPSGDQNTTIFARQDCQCRRLASKRPVRRSKTLQSDSQKLLQVNGLQPFKRRPYWSTYIALHTGELVKDDYFTLFEAVGALEVRLIRSKKCYIQG